MKIAIVGAGFGGLSVAWHLVQGAPAVEVTLFDDKGIGGGASGIAAGLLHPYVGAEGKRSARATQALEAAIELIGLVEKERGISLKIPGLIRKITAEPQRALFEQHAALYGDVRFMGPFECEIVSGCTVDCPGYLAGLWESLAARGVLLRKERVNTMEQLKAFDRVVIAAGAGVISFWQGDRPFGITKGQVLQCRGAALPPLSTIGQGYCARWFEKGYLGSTYEREWESEEPDPEAALAQLRPKVEGLGLEWERLEITGCRAGLRVVRKGHYLPLIFRKSEKVFVLTALGSRGLLYHALAAKAVAKAVLTGEVEW